MSTNAPGVTDPEVQKILDGLPADSAAEEQGLEAQPAAEQGTATKESTVAKIDDARADPEKDKQGNVRNALRASRHAEKVMREKLDAAQRELEELRNAAPAKSDEPSGMNAEEFAQFKEDFPVYAKEVERAKQLQDEIERLKKAAPQEKSEDFQPIVYQLEIQHVIDQNDDLLAWQHDPAAQDKFALAIEYDASLLADPDWKTKPLAERFEEAVKRTKRKLSDKGESHTDPAKIIADAPTNRPKGISDFRGGAPATAPTQSYSKMSVEDILASLPTED